MRTPRLLGWLLLLWAVIVSGQDREGKQLTEPEQKYDFQLSFPVDSDEATNVADGTRQKLEDLLNSILLETEALVS